MRCYPGYNCYMATRRPNPYRPGFNQAPAELVGRDTVLAAAREALAVAALDGRTPRPIVLVGGRGVGKTVTLGEIAAIAAEEHSWLTVPIEIRPNRSFTPQLIERLDQARGLYRQQPPGKRLSVTAATIRANVLGVGGELELKRASPTASASAAPLESALAEACEAAAAHSGGLVLAVDEVQLANQDELADLAATLQEHVPDNWPLVVALAGLPTMRNPKRTPTYFERGEWHIIARLDPASTHQALARPAEAAGRPMTTPACELLAEASGGYPYAIQVMGHHAWRASTGADRITDEHARQALDAAHQDLAAGLYASRWADASPTEQTYLAVMAELVINDRAATGGEVARRLGKTPNSVSYLRDRLLKKGTIFQTDNALEFAVPGLADWIIAQTREDH